MTNRALARLALVLRGSWGAHHREHQSLRRRLEEARAAVHKWKTRAADAEARTRALRERAAAVQKALGTARHTAAAARRETPSIAVVKSVFQHRLRTLPARTRALPLDDDERRFLTVSASYRGAVEGRGAPSGSMSRGTLDGLVWWTPGRSEDTRLPYRAILQTREAASGGVMLDLGANVGRMAVPRVILGDATSAYCAEPDPVTFACLARNVIDNGLRGLVLPDQTAIGDRDGTARLLRAGHSGNFRLVADDSGGQVIEVPCCTLDTWIDRLQIDPAIVTFIKVDVEGFERRVLAGAARVLANRHITWQMEVKPSGLRAAGDEPHALYAGLQQWFTHFIDLNRAASGRRVRPVAEVAGALSYIEPAGKTDVLLFTAAGRVA